MVPIIEKLLTNYNRPFRPLKSLKAIVIHWTANTGKKANALAHFNYFNQTKDERLKNNNGKLNYGSTHYVVDSEIIYRFIPDDEMAYHVGAKNYKAIVDEKIVDQAGASPNYYTIGIEMCVNSDGDFSKTRQNTIELTDYLLRKYNLSTNDVYRHFDITGKDCPKMMLDESIWGNFLNDIKVFNNSTLKLRVETSELNIRIGPSTNYPVTRKLKSGQIVPKLDQDGLWYKIGSDEWIHSNYVIVL